MTKLALILAEGFEEVEALTPVDLLRRAGIECETLSLDSERLVVGSHGIPVLADKRWEDADFSAYDGVILPGGLKGTHRLYGDTRLEALLQEYSAAGKLTAAICAAPTVLSEAGLLKGKRAVCYPELEEQLDGAILTREEAVLDGPVLTSRGMGTAIPFGLKIVEYFRGKESAKALAEKIVYKETEE